MIYVTPAVALATDPQDANAPWIGYQSVLTRDNVSADVEAAQFPVSNVVTTSTSAVEKWKGTSTAAQRIMVAEGGTQECDYFGVAKHNFGSTGATIKLQNSADGVTWADVTGTIAPGDDNAIMFRFTGATANHWALLITPGTAAPQVTVFYLGLLLVGQRRIYVGHTPLTLGRNQQVTTGLSEGGAFLGRVKRREFLASKVDLQNLTPSWYRTKFDPFAEASIERPFFWAWRPGDYPNEVGYAWVDGGIKPSNQSPNGFMQVSFDIQGVR
jgi:hypothetical protein